MDSPLSSDRVYPAAPLAAAADQARHDLATPEKAATEASPAVSQAPATANPAIPELTPAPAPDFRPDSIWWQQSSTDPAALRNRAGST